MRAAALATLLAAVAGTAVALWNGEGRGTASAPTALLDEVTIAPGVPSGQLFPGGSSDVALTMSNPNAATAHIGSFTLDEDQGTNGLTVDGAHAACDASALTFTTATRSGGWSVPGTAAGSGVATDVILPDALAMSLDAVDACQGVTVTVFVRAGP